MVHKVFKAEELGQRSLEFAGDLSERATQAISAIKKYVRQGHDLPMDEGLKLEPREFLRLLRTQDAREGLDAFVGKRKPRFKGI